MEKGTTVWRKPEKPIQVAGLGWYAQERLWRRMEAKPPFPLPEGVAGLVHNTAGAQIRFRSDSRTVAVRVRLTAPPGMDHMPATGQGGVDCYYGRPGAYRYAATARPKPGACDYETVLFESQPRAARTFVLNLPLYDGVEEILVGLERGARVLPPPAYESGGRIVVYGTSITQGGCATRPGMAWTNILSRRINREFVNLGFSGSGKGEPEMARNIARIRRPTCFVLDYEANCVSTERFRETLPEFVRILREAHPAAPVLVVSAIRYARDGFDPANRAQRLARLRFQRSLVERLRKAGDRQVFFVNGSGLLGTDYDECTVDGVHPTDLGFLRIADALEPAIRRVLR